MIDQSSRYSWAKNLAPAITLSVLLAMTVEPVVAQWGNVGTTPTLPGTRPVGVGGVPYSGAIPGGYPSLYPTGVTAPTGSGTSGYQPGPATQTTTITNPDGTTSTQTYNVMPSTVGCDQQTVAPALANTAHYSYAQTYAAAVNTVQQPKAYSNCIQTLIKDAQLLNNMFSNGFTWSALIKTFSGAGTNNLLDSLENQVCKQIQNAANGVFGTINKDLTKLGIGVVVSMQPGGVPNIAATYTPPPGLAFPMPTNIIQDPSPVAPVTWPSNNVGGNVVLNVGTPP